MQFTQREEKLIKRLRKQDRQWSRWQRWVFLVLGVLLLVVMGPYTSTLFSLLNRYEERPDINEVLLIAVLVPKVFINLAIGLGLLVFTLRDWHGNVTRMLLLKLLDAEQNRNDGEQATPR